MLRLLLIVLCSSLLIACDSKPETSPTNAPELAERTSPIAPANEPVKGHLIVNANAAFVLYFNEQKIAEGGTEPQILALEVEPGDRIAARCTGDDDGMAGFALVFVAENGSTAFATDPYLGWVNFTPEDPDLFWLPTGITDPQRCGVGSDQMTKTAVTQKSQFPCDAIWGPLTEDTVYFYKKIMPRDLR